MVYDVIIGDGADYSIGKARRFTPAEEAQLAGWLLVPGFHPVGEPKELKHIHFEDMPKRRCDGVFPSPCGSSRVWIITSEESAAYAAEDERRAAEELAARKAEEVADLERLISLCESQRDYGAGLWEGLPGRAEVTGRLKTLNNILNEGGEGHLPHICCAEEYEWAKTRLAALRAGRGRLVGRILVVD